MSDPFDIRLAGPDDMAPTQGMRLVDVLDRLLDRGVVLKGEICLTVADIDLVTIAADIVIASPDTVRAHQRLRTPT